MLQGWPELHVMTTQAWELLNRPIADFRQNSGLNRESRLSY